MASVYPLQKGKGVPRTVSSGDNYRRDGEQGQEGTKSKVDNCRKKPN